MLPNTAKKIRRCPFGPINKMSVVEVKTEVEAEGYRLDKVIETLPRQHIIIFKKLSM